MVIEEYLVGEEVSLFALCDGEIAIPFGVAKDHKRVGDGDVGPNTGGMGAYSPVPSFSQAQEDWTMDHIIRPTLRELTSRSIQYRGVLYAGLMITSDGMKLIEFNVRFGDPECQALMLRLQSDPLSAFRAACEGRLRDASVRWDDRTAIAIVMATEGYPEAPMYGGTIEGLDSIVVPNVEIFHAGTQADDKGRIHAVGGRVLTVCGIGDDIAAARAITYPVVADINWPQALYRRDIGWRVV